MPLFGPAPQGSCWSSPCSSPSSLSWSLQLGPCLGGLTWSAGSGWDDCCCRYHPSGTWHKIWQLLYQLFWHWDILSILFHCLMSHQYSVYPPGVSGDSGELKRHEQKAEGEAEWRLDETIRPRQKPCGASARRCFWVSAGGDRIPVFERIHGTCNRMYWHYAHIYIYWMWLFN